MTPKMKELFNVRQNMTIHDLAYLESNQRYMDYRMTKFPSSKSIRAIWEEAASNSDAIINKYLIQGK
jgi:hypothetical protein